MAAWLAFPVGAQAAGTVVRSTWNRFAPTTTVGSSVQISGQSNDTMEEKAKIGHRPVFAFRHG
jgi:hypothetical protein